MRVVTSVDPDQGWGLGGEATGALPPLTSYRSAALLRLYTGHPWHLESKDSLPAVHFNATLIRVPIAFFRELEQRILISTEPTQTASLKKEQSWRHHAPRFQAILQSYNHRNSMALPQKYTHRSMEHNTEPRNKPKLMWPINLQQGRQEYTMWKSLYDKTLGKLDNYMQGMKLDHCLTPHTEINLRWIKDLFVGPETIKLL